MPASGSGQKKDRGLTQRASAIHLFNDGSRAIPPFPTNPSPPARMANFTTMQEWISEAAKHSRKSLPRPTHWLFPPEKKFSLPTSRSQTHRSHLDMTCCIYSTNVGGTIATAISIPLTPRLNLGPRSKKASDSGSWEKKAEAADGPIFISRSKIESLPVDGEPKTAMPFS